MQTLQWWVYPSFAVHPNCHSHIRVTQTDGKGAVYLMSSKQKLNTCSLTKTEHVSQDSTYGIIHGVL